MMFAENKSFLSLISYLKIPQIEISNGVKKTNVPV